MGGMIKGFGPDSRGDAKIDDAPGVEEDGAEEAAFGLSAVWRCAYHFTCLRKRITEFEKLWIIVDVEGDCLRRREGDSIIVVHCTDDYGSWRRSEDNWLLVRRKEIAT